MDMERKIGIILIAILGLASQFVGAAEEIVCPTGTMDVGSGNKPCYKEWAYDMPESPWTDGCPNPVQCDGNENDQIWTAVREMEEVNGSWQPVTGILGRWHVEARGKNNQPGVPGHNRHIGRDVDEIVVNGTPSDQEWIWTRTPNVAQPPTSPWWHAKITVTIDEPINTEEPDYTVLEEPYDGTDGVCPEGTYETTVYNSANRPVSTFWPCKESAAWGLDLAGALAIGTNGWTDSTTNIVHVAYRTYETESTCRASYKNAWRGPEGVAARFLHYNKGLAMTAAGDCVEDSRLAFDRPTAKRYYTEYLFNSSSTPPPPPGYHAKVAPPEPECPTGDHSHSERGCHTNSSTGENGDHHNPIDESTMEHSTWDACQNLSVGTKRNLCLTSHADDSWSAEYHKDDNYEEDISCRDDIKWSKTEGSDVTDQNVAYGRGEGPLIGDGDKHSHVGDYWCAKPPDVSHANITAPVERDGFPEDGIVNTCTIPLGAGDSYKCPASARSGGGGYVSCIDGFEVPSGGTDYECLMLSSDCASAIWRITNNSDKNFVGNSVGCSPSDGDTFPYLTLTNCPRGEHKHDGSECHVENDTHTPVVEESPTTEQPEVANDDHCESGGTCNWRVNGPFYELEDDSMPSWATGVVAVKKTDDYRFKFFTNSCNVPTEIVLSGFVSSGTGISSCRGHKRGMLQQLRVTEDDLVAAGVN